MKLKYFLCIIFLFHCIEISGQLENEFFPNDLLVQPFVANFFEPKAGVEFKTAHNDLQLNIGTSRDLYHLVINENERIAFGADFFTSTRLRGETGFNFPVDAVDYFFGINVSNKIKFGDEEFGFRLRLSHISAHFVDGHYETKHQDWKDGLSPIIYSREFIEILSYYSINNIRTYLGFSYLLHVVPKDVGKDIYQIGGEKFFANIFGEWINPFFAYDFKLYKIDKYVGSNTFKFGLKYGKIKSTGMSLYFLYFSGLNTQGEYFMMYENYLSIGFNVDI